MSALFKLNEKDLIRGLIMAVMTAIFGSLIQLIQNGSNISVTDMQEVARAVIIVVLAYLSKNLATSEDGKLGGRWQIK